MKKGFISIISLVAVLALSAILGAGVYYQHNKKISASLVENINKDENANKENPAEEIKSESDPVESAPEEVRQEEPETKEAEVAIKQEKIVIKKPVKTIAVKKEPAKQINEEFIQEKSELLNTIADLRKQLVENKLEQIAVIEKSQQDTESMGSVMDAIELAIKEKLGTMDYVDILKEVNLERQMKFEQIKQENFIKTQQLERKQQYLEDSVKYYEYKLEELEKSF